MTRLLVELDDERDEQVLVPLLNRLHIRFERSDKKPTASESDREEALRIIRQGCDMSSFGDALAYEREIRQERALPYRDKEL